MHYDEAKQHFPREFGLLFGRSSIKLKNRKRKPHLNESAGFQDQSVARLDSVDAAQMQSIQYPPDVNQSELPLNMGHEPPMIGRITRTDTVLPAGRHPTVIGVVNEGPVHSLI